MGEVTLRIEREDLGLLYYLVSNHYQRNGGKHYAGTDPGTEGLLERCRDLMGRLEEVNGKPFFFLAG